MRLKSIVSAAILSASLLLAGDTTSHQNTSPLRVCHDDPPEQLETTFDAALSEAQSLYASHDIPIRRANTSCVTIQYTPVTEWLHNDSLGYQSNTIPDSLSQRTYFPDGISSPDRIADSVQSLQSTVEDHGITLFHAFSSSEGAQQYQRIHELGHYATNSNTITIRPYNTVEAAATSGQPPTKAASYTIAHEIGHKLLLPHREEWKHQPTSIMSLNEATHSSNIMTRFNPDTTGNKESYTLSPTQAKLAKSYLNGDLSTYEDSTDAALDRYWQEHYPGTDQDDYIDTSHVPQAQRNDNE